MLFQTIPLYPDRTDVTLTTYIQQDSPELLNGKRRPAVLICPGGAYLSCSDREAEPVALAFAAMGYHAFVLRYSTLFGGSTVWPDFSKEPDPRPESRYPNPVWEIGQSVLLLHDRAAEWQIDTDKIAVCGFSAGAHNAAMYGVYWHTPLLSAHFGRPAADFKPAAVVLGYTLSDYCFMKKNAAAANPMDVALFNASNIGYLGTKTPTDALLAEVSPALQVSAHTPPMFLWATSADALVPVQHTLRMARALADQNIPFELHIFENGPHGLSLATQETASAQSQVDRDAAKWVGLADAWLQKRFALPLPEKIDWEDALQANGVL